MRWLPRMLVRALCGAIVVTLASGFPGYAQEANTQAWPGWVSEKPVLSRHYRADNYLRCTGDGCAGDTLACTLFQMPIPSDEEATFNLEQLPWGQIKKFMASQLEIKRQDILGPSPTIDDVKSLAEPGLHQIDGRQLASASYIVQSRNTDIGFSVAFWVEGHAMHGLRCSHRLTGSDEAAGRIAALLAMRISAPEAQ